MISKSRNNIDLVCLASVLTDIKFNLFLVMSDQNFVLSDQDGVLRGQLSFQEKKIFAALYGGLIWRR